MGWDGMGRLDGDMMGDSVRDWRRVETDLMGENNMGEGYLYEYYLC